MTDLRDKIAAILAENTYVGCDHWNTADAIIAALPNMIRPLVWEKLSDRSHRCKMGGKVSWRCESYVDGTWFLTYSVPGFCDTLINTEWPTLDEAKAEANAHYRAIIMAAFGVRP